MNAVGAAKVWLAAVLFAAIVSASVDLRCPTLLVCMSPVITVYVESTAINGYLLILLMIDLLIAYSNCVYRIAPL